MTTAAASIEEPSVLLTVPKPFDANNGHTWVGSSFSIVNEKKRTRPELVVGADGSNVNLYGVKNGKLLASHAFPPQSRLLSAPCALIRKGNKTRPNESYTYTAIRDDSTQDTDRIECRQQSIDRPGQISHMAIAPQNTSLDLGCTEDPVLRIEPFANARKKTQSAAQHQVVILQKSGRVTCVSADLQQHEWTTELNLTASSTESDTPKSEVDVRGAFVDSGSSLEQGFLAHHPNLLKSLTSHSETSQKELRHALLIGYITHDNSLGMQSGGSTESLHLFGLLQPNQTPTHQLQVTPLFDCELGSVPGSGDAGPSQHHVSLKRGFFIKLYKNRVQIVDLFQPKLRTVFDHVDSSQSFMDCIMVNRSICALSTSNSCQLIDIRYRSVLATYSFAAQEQPGVGRKRKRSDNSSTSGPIAQLTFFEKASILAGLSAGILTKCQIKLHRIETTNEKRKRSRIADSIGHALSHDSRNIPNDETSSELSKIFVYRRASSADTEDHSFKLQIQHTSHATFSSLAARGCITTSRIQQVVSHRDRNGTIPAAINAADVIEALTDYDPTHTLVAELVFQSPVLGLPMTTHALKTLLHSFDYGQSQRHRRLPEKATNLVNGDLDHEVEVEEEDAAREIELASELLESGLQIRTSAITTCFEKLATCFHPQQVSRSFRSILSTQEQLLMIDLLRHELREGGWASHTLDLVSDASFLGTQTHAITAICQLLNCALDALGTGSFLPDESLKGEQDVTSYFTALRDETSAVLEGVQEASFFDGFLRELVTFERKLEDPTRSIFSGGKRGGRRATERYLGDLVEPAGLPISSKMVENIPKTRIAQGGEIKKRSARDIGQRISQRIGPYSFETIRFQ